MNQTRCRHWDLLIMTYMCNVIHRKIATWFTVCSKNTSLSSCILFSIMIRGTYFNFQTCCLLATSIQCVCVAVLLLHIAVRIKNLCSTNVGWNICVEYEIPISFCFQNTSVEELALVILTNSSFMRIMHTFFPPTVSRDF